MEKVTATGAIATGVASFASALQPRMTATMAQLSEDRVIAGTKVRLWISNANNKPCTVTPYYQSISKKGGKNHKN